MDKLIIIGTISRPQGIKGEVKVSAFTDNAMRFSDLEEVFIDKKIHYVENVRSNGKELFVKFKEINDRNTAELYRNKDIVITDDYIQEPEEGRYYIADLVGCKVLVADKVIGVLEEILQNGAADVYIVKDIDRKIIMFPALKNLIMSVDINERLIILDSKRFGEVAVYED